MPKIDNTLTLTAHEQTLLEEMNNLRSVYPWVICLEFLNTSAISNLASNTEDVVWDSTTFSAFPFKIDRVPSTSSGTFPTTSISMFNTLSVAKLINDNNGFIGEDVSLYFLNMKVTDDFTKDNYPYRFNFRITGCVIGQYIQFQLGTPNYLKTYLPNKSYIREYCPFVFKGEHCWMRDFSDLFAAYDSLHPDCDSLDPAVIDCLAIDCDKSYAQCKIYWQNAKDLQPDLTNTVPIGIPFGGYPTVAKGDLKY